MRCGDDRRSRAAVPAALAALALLCLLPFAPRTPGPHGVHRAGGPPAPTGDPAPPDDWRRHGRFLPPAEAYPAVVRVVDGAGRPFCTGSVVRSPGGDIVMTAAHCVYGGGSYPHGADVLPDAAGTTARYGAWHVDRIWVDPRYTGGHDTRYDYAFLRVTRPDGRRIEDVVGADTLRVDAPFTLRRVTTTGYPDRADPGGLQLSCTLETYRSVAHPPDREMHCGGYTAGVSGSPWVLLRPGARTGELVGLIGGFNGGGPPDGSPHEDAISYSPYFTGAARALLDRAARGDGGHPES